MWCTTYISDPLQCSSLPSHSGTDAEALRCILHHLISLGPQVLEVVGRNRSFLMFKLFWSTCVTLASSDTLNEHITLLKAAAQWLSTR